MRFELDRRGFLVAAGASVMATAFPELHSAVAQQATGGAPTPHQQQERKDMTLETLQQIWKTYQDAWADIAADERERLLRQSVTDDVIFTAPPYEGQGLGNLVKRMEQFQEQVPGAHFKSNKLLTQHGQLLVEWTMYNKDGSVSLISYSYARFNEQGRLTHLAGFW
jgi:hypothetical protein